MARAALLFFVLAVITVLIGAYGITGYSIRLFKILAMIFLSLGAISYIGSSIMGKKNEF